MSAVASCPRCHTVLDCPHCPPESPESHERGGKATTQPADATNPPWPPHVPNPQHAFHSAFEPSCEECARYRKEIA